MQYNLMSDVAAEISKFQIVLHVQVANVLVHCYQCVYKFRWSAAKFKRTVEHCVWLVET